MNKQWLNFLQEVKNEKASVCYSKQAQHVLNKLQELFDNFKYFILKSFDTVLTF